MSMVRELLDDAIALQKDGLRPSRISLALTDRWEAEELGAAGKVKRTRSPGVNFSNRAGLRTSKLIVIAGMRPGISSWAMTTRRSAGPTRSRQWQARAWTRLPKPWSWIHGTSNRSRATS